MLYVICKAQGWLKASAHAQTRVLSPVLPLGFGLARPGRFPGGHWKNCARWKTSQDWLGLPKATGEPSSWRGKETVAIGGPC